MFSSITPNFISNPKICIVMINDSIYPPLLRIFPKLLWKSIPEGVHLFTSLKWVLYLLPITCNIKGSHLSQIQYDYSYPKLLRLWLTITPNKKVIRIWEFHHDHKQLLDCYWGKQSVAVVEWNWICSLLCQEGWKTLKSPTQKKNVSLTALFSQVVFPDWRSLRLSLRTT